MTLSMNVPEFDLSFEPAYGQAVPVARDVERMTVNNPSAFTFHGTNSYIVGGGSSVAVIDPGPENEEHFQALITALGERQVSHIFVSHTHGDHSPLHLPTAKALRATAGS
jgi:glyoxylase-like metal-dependent hydrolase (beta-lactamase superfamily II)